jgi:hypothetical protein
MAGNRITLGGPCCVAIDQFAISTKDCDSDTL